VLRGDLHFAEQCAQSAAAFAARNRLEMAAGLRLFAAAVAAVGIAARGGLALFELLVEDLRAQLDQVQAALAAQPDQIIVRPRTEPILTGVSDEL
jgi:hypothetical protein